MLKDAASLQQRDTEWENKRRRREGKKEIDCLYTMEDVDAALSLHDSFAYGQRSEIVAGIEVCFRDAGHISGSAIVEIFVTEDGT